MYCFTAVIIIYYIVTMLFSPSFSSSCFPSSLGASPFTRGRKGLGTQTDYFPSVPVFSPPISVIPSFGAFFIANGALAAADGRYSVAVGRISLIWWRPPGRIFYVPRSPTRFYGDAIRHDTGTGTVDTAKEKKQQKS